MKTQELRLTLLTQIFAVILVIKSLATTYFATYYGLHEYEQVIWSYGNTLNQIAIFLVIPLALVSTTLIFDWSEKTKRVLEIISVVSMMVITIIILFYKPF